MKKNKKTQKTGFFKKKNTVLGVRVSLGCVTPVYLYLALVRTLQQGLFAIYAAANMAANKHKSKVLVCTDSGQNVEDFPTTFGPNLALKAPKRNLRMLGGKISFLRHVCGLKMLRILWGIQICMHNMKIFCDRRPRDAYSVER